MTGERVLSIRVRTIGQETVQRSIRGITASARQATRIQERAAQQTAQASIRSERMATREAATSARTRERIAQREAQARTRAAAQAQRQQTQAAARAAREQAQIDRQLMRDEARNAQEVFRTRQRLRQLDQRAQQQQRREAERQRTSRGRMERYAMGGAAGAASAVALSALNGSLSAITQRLETITAAVGGRAGVVDVGQRTANAQDFELAMARSSGEFFQGTSIEERARQMALLTDEINQVALASGQSPTELLGVMTTMQQQFSQFGVARRDLGAIADEAQRTGGDMNDLATFIGNLNQQLGDTAPTAERAFDIMAQGGLQGAITPESFASNFGGMLGQFQSQTGLQGEDALRQFMALANAIRPGATSDAEAATQLRGLMSSMGDDATRGRIALATGGHHAGRGAHAGTAGGSQFLTPDGRVDYMQLVRDLSSVEGVGDTNTVFHNSRARMAISSLTRSQRGETSGPSAETLAAVSSDEGRMLRQGTLATVQGTSAFESRLLAVQGEVEGIRQSGSRVGQANTLLAFNEAVTQTGHEGLVGGLGAVMPDIVMQQAIPALASFISGMSPERRAGISGTIDAIGRAGAAMPVMGGAIGAAAGGIGGAFGALGQIGDRASAISAQSRVQIQDGARMELGDTTIDRLGRTVASSLPAPSAPSALGSGAPERRVPADRR